MIVRVKLFAIAKERAGCEALSIELPTGATVAALGAEILRSNPELKSVLPHAMWAVDATYADNKTILTSQSEVALIPPVSGG